MLKTTKLGNFKNATQKQQNSKPYFDVVIIVNEEMFIQVPGEPMFVMTLMHCCSGWLNAKNIIFPFTKFVSCSYGFKKCQKNMLEIKLVKND